MEQIEIIQAKSRQTIGGVGKVRFAEGAAA